MHTLEKRLNYTFENKELLERAHILVSPGDVFGLAGKQHFRIACTVDIEKLREAYDRMEALRF